MKSIFLFSHDSPSLESDLFTVVPGHVVILTAHAVKDGTHPSPFEGQFDEHFRILVEKSSTPPGDLGIESVKDTLEGVQILPKATPRYITPMVTCCGWELSACDTVRVIAVPGVYRLRMSDADMLGTAVVEAYSINNDQAASLPESLKFGY